MFQKSLSRLSDVMYKTLFPLTCAFDGCCPLALESLAGPLDTGLEPGTTFWAIMKGEPGSIILLQIDFFVDRRAILPLTALDCGYVTRARRERREGLEAGKQQDLIQTSIGFGPQNCFT